MSMWGTWVSDSKEGRKCLISVRQRGFRPCWWRYREYGADYGDRDVGPPGWDVTFERSENPWSFGSLRSIIWDVRQGDRIKALEEVADALYGHAKSLVGQGWYGWGSRGN